MKAYVTWRWAAICSACEQHIRFKVGDKVPNTCPNCGVEFDRSVDNHSLTHSEEDHTLEPRELKE